MFVALVPAFAVTGSVTRMYRDHERALAAEWYERAEMARRTGDLEGAVRGLQSALRFSPGDPGYTFSLARALILAGRTTEARAYLRTLWAREPGNGPVNIELGRIAAREGDVTEAVRYYHSAVEGSWRESPEANRRKARLELAEYLVRSGDFARAQAELIPLSADLPEDVGTMVAVGGLLLASGAPGRARDVFEAALARDRRSPAALSGAADAAFQLGEYASAVSYSRRATAAGADAASLEPEASLAAEVLRGDPFQRRLSARERARRAFAAYERAVARAAECPDAASHATELEALRARATLRALQRDLDLVETVMELAYRTETSASRSCSATADAGDTALLLIGRQHFGT